MAVLMITIVIAWIIFSALLIITVCIRNAQLGECNRSELDNEQMRILKSMRKRNKYDS